MGDLVSQELTLHPVRDATQPRNELFADEVRHAQGVGGQEARLDDEIEERLGLGEQRLESLSTVATHKIIRIETVRQRARVTSGSPGPSAPSSRAGPIRFIYAMISVNETLPRATSFFTAPTSSV